MKNKDFSLSRRRLLVGAAALGGGAFLGMHVQQAQAASFNLLNVSYDPTRELYAEVDKAFANTWHQAHPEDSVTVKTARWGIGRTGAFCTGRCASRCGHIRLGL